MACYSSSMERNIVLIGKSGSGKSTLGNKLLGWEAFTAGDSPDPVTQQCSWVFGQQTVDGTTLSLNVLDTPGLQDSSWSNDAVMRTIYQEAKKKKITAVIIVLKQGRMIDEVDMFEDIFKHYNYQAPSVSALVITKCEGANKDAIAYDFKTNYRTKNIAAKMQLGICSVGFPSSYRMQQALRANIQEDTQNVLRLVAGLNYEYNASAIFK